jgi:hypothetical protein
MLLGKKQVAMVAQAAAVLQVGQVEQEHQDKVTREE